MNTKTAKVAIQIRTFEETLLDLFSKGRLHGTVHTCIGQELVACAIVGELSRSDWVFSNHRCHGHYLAWNGDKVGLLAEIMGLPSGICGGRGGSQHIYREQFLSNGVQGGGVPIAAGCAQAMKMQGGSKGVAVAFIGDGTLGQGVIYEVLNLAAKWDLPLLLVLEKNGYAQSTNTVETIAGNIRKRFEGFGLNFWEASIWDEPALFSAARDAVGYVRNHRKPAIISIECYRLKAHSKGDDNRSSEEIQRYQKIDPINIFSETSPSDYQSIREEAVEEIRAIIASLDSKATVTDSNLPLKGQNDIRNGSWNSIAEQNGKPERVLERLRMGLKQLLAADNRVIVFGEDIEDPYGGAFKVTKGLSSEFGERVRNTPISEAAIVGLGNGLALAGFRPVVEIMFGDFITLAADQLINQGSKFSYMYNDQVAVPLIVRTPMGGKRGYGSTHSQCLERHFIGTPGLSVVCVNSVFDPAELLSRVHKGISGPCLFIENKLAYSALVHNTAPDGRIWEKNDSHFPTLRLSGRGFADVTLVTYGGMVEDAEEAAKQAFERFEIVVELIVPTIIYPLDRSPIIESVRSSGRLLTVEEGQGFSGLGAEIIACCAEQGVLKKSSRVFAADHPIPCARDLEKNALPNFENIVTALQGLMNS